MRIQLHPEAIAEIASAQEFYDNRLPGLGSDLEDAIDSALSMIAAMPEAWTAWSDLPEVRVFQLDRFPFSLPYIYENDRVVLLALAHSKRRPGYWRGRVGDV